MNSLAFWKRCFILTLASGLRLRPSTKSWGLFSTRFWIFRRYWSSYLKGRQPPNLIGNKKFQWRGLESHFSTPRKTMKTLSFRLHCLQPLKTQNTWNCPWAKTFTPLCQLASMLTIHRVWVAVCKTGHCSKSSQQARTYSHWTIKCWTSTVASADTSVLCLRCRRVYMHRRRGSWSSLCRWIWANMRWEWETIKRSTWARLLWWIIGQVRSNIL